MKAQTGFIKTQCAGWVQYEINAQARRANRTTHANVVMGLVDGRLKRWVDEGQDFIYLDHSYFMRGWSTNNFRAIRKACHLNVVKKRPDDRLRKFGVEIEPWRKKRGSKIVLIPTYSGHEAIWPEMRTWLKQTESRLREMTDRQIAVKWEKGSLRAYLEDAWCVVCNQSVAGVEAALMGVPVFSTPKCPSFPVANDLSMLDEPEYPERFEWACSLAYASWNSSEIDEVQWLDYDYELRHDLP